jgi:hypothetical protein
MRTRHVTTVGCVLALVGLAATAHADETTGLRLKGSFGEGAGVESADGSFGMNLRARAQVRSTVVVPEEDDRDPSADFQIRRMRLSLDAHGWDKLVSLRVQLAFATPDLDPVAPSALRDAFVTLAPLRDLKIRAGQMKVPYGRQRVVSSGNLQMVDRSLVTAELNLDRDVGVTLFSDDLGGLKGLLGYQVGVFGGDGRNRVSGGYGLLYAGRIAIRPVGGERGDDLDEVDFGKDKPRLQLAVSGAFNHQTDRERSTIGHVFETGPWADYAHAGADTSFKYRGLSLTGEFFLRHALEDRHAAEEDGVVLTDVARAGYGGFFQAGKLLGEHLELSGRIGVLQAMGDRTSGFRSERELGGGVSYYVKKHALKVQADTFYIWEHWGEGRVQGRLQLQIAP